MIKNEKGIGRQMKVLKFGLYTLDSEAHTTGSYIPHFNCSDRQR